MVHSILTPDALGRDDGNQAEPAVHPKPRAFPACFAVDFARLLRFGSDSFLANRRRQRAVVAETAVAAPCPPYATTSRA